MASKKSTKNKSKSRKNKNKISFARYKKILFVMLFGLIGLLMIYKSFAASNTVNYEVTLTRSQPSSSYEITTGSGLIEASLEAPDPKLHLEITDSSGSSIAEAKSNRGKKNKGDSDIIINQKVNAGTYEIKVGYNGKIRNDIKTTLKIKYPEKEQEDPGEPKDTTPPTTVIITPTGGIVSGTIEIKADATDSSGIEKVEFYINGRLHDTDATSSYRTTWDTTKVNNDTHSILVISYDNAGNTGRSSTTVQVDNKVPEPPRAESGVFISTEKILELPKSGVAWERVRSNAYGSWDTRWITDQNSNISQHLYAGALVSVAENNKDLENKVRANLDKLVNEWNPNERSLGISRNLAAAIVAADILDHRTPEFTNWVKKMLTHNFSGRTIISTHQDRPNNWGTHAGASRIAAEIFIDGFPSSNSVNVHKAWLGEYDAWPNFESDFGITSSDTSWQSDPARPVGVNPAGATISGRSVDGVLPDDQRRSGWFNSSSWPPPGEDYVYNALAPAAITNEILAKNGYGSWSWSSNAMKRAVAWLNDEAKFTANDAAWDGAWISVHLVNKAHGTSFPWSTDKSHPTRNSLGNAMDFVDWTHQ